ncbi:hypothetical protein KQ945_08055 [Bacillus subtilis subsp. subtilis]|nr:hypothetical protein [Bacillus subtilis subsp. subtilis]
MKTLSLLSLLACTCFATATHAAEPAPVASGAACITLSPDQQIVRAGADRDILLRNADQHYIVRFKDSCTSAAQTADLHFDTPERDGQLCGGGVSSLRTKSQKCAISEVELITPKQFGARARARR